MLCLWVASGYRHVEQQGLGAGVTYAYMDDRTFQTKTWAEAAARQQSWASWSKLVGLKENLEKIQVAARGRQAEETLLRDVPEEWRTADIRMLGANSLHTRRTSTALEKDKLQAASRRIRLLCL